MRAAKSLGVVAINISRGLATSAIFFLGHETRRLNHLLMIHLDPKLLWLDAKYKMAPRYMVRDLSSNRGSASKCAKYCGNVPCMTHPTV